MGKGKSQQLERGKISRQAWRQYLIIDGCLSRIKESLGLRWPLPWCFQEPDAHLFLDPKALSAKFKEPVARQQYVKAFKHADFEVMLNRYKIQQNHNRS